MASRATRAVRVRPHSPARRTRQYSLTGGYRPSKVTYEPESDHPARLRSPVLDHLSKIPIFPVLWSEKRFSRYEEDRDVDEVAERGRESGFERIRERERGERRRLAAWVGRIGRDGLARARSEGRGGRRGCSDDLRRRLVRMRRGRQEETAHKDCERVDRRPSDAVQAPHERDEVGVACTFLRDQLRHD